MELFLARFEHHGGGPRRRKTIFRAVIRGKGTEFGDGLQRWHHAETSFTPAVISLATINDEAVVAGAKPVKTDIGIRAYRQLELEIPIHGVRNARQERSQQIDVAAVSGDLGNLLPADHTADFARIRLDGDRARFHRDLLGGTAEFQFEVNTQPIADGEDN